MTDPRYVVATDLSRASRNGGAAAAALAQKTGAGLDFFCSVPPHAAADMEGFLDAVQRGVDEMATEYGGKGLSTTAKVTVSRDAATAVVSHARRVGAELIVVSPQGLTGWKKLVLGSVTEQVMRLAPAMLLIARSSWRKPLQRILVAVDMSPGAARALRKGLELARDLGVEAHVFHVVKPPSMLIHVEEALEQANSYRRERARTKKAHEEFAAWVARRSLAGARISTAVAEGSPAELIVKEAKDAKADLVVLGTHGKSRTEEFFVGSVARAVATAAPVSVLLVRARPPRHRKS